MKFNQSGGIAGGMYVGTAEPEAIESLRDVIAAMGMRIAKRRLEAMKAEAYPTTPYLSKIDFVKDVAALAKSFPDQMARPIRTGKKRTTVLTSLGHAVSPRSLEYMFNGSRFAAANPDVRIMYGTTRNEAVHMQLKAFWRNVIFQTRRHAHVVAAVATLTKLIVSHLKRAEVTRGMEDHELLRVFCRMLVTKGFEFHPLFHFVPARNPVVDVAALLANATLIRKRPAAAQGGRAIRLRQ